MPHPRAEPAHKTVRRDVTVSAPIEAVWEAVATEGGRQRWLEPDPDRRLVVDRLLEPNHVSWWRWQESGTEPARRVDVELDEAPGGTRITVTESQPTLTPSTSLGATAPASLACV